MLEELQALQGELLNELEAVQSLADLEAFRLRHLVRRGTLGRLRERFRELPADQKPVVGRLLNELESTIRRRFEEHRHFLEVQAEERLSVDLSLPGRYSFLGGRHPIQQVLDEVIAIFRRLGFVIATGPDIEDDEHNFTALNFPPEHPARDMQDTFFLTPDRQILLRTHTSPVQLRLMRALVPPIRAIVPGRVYRNEEINPRSLAEFHQVEGLVVDRTTSFAELKGTLVAFAQQMYGNGIAYRFRPSFFPFTEPSAEMDIQCFLCRGSGCRVCKGTGWLEICGCGMVHPTVLRNGGIDPETYLGFAFGMGIERVAMLRFGLDDIRLLYQNDLRVLRQFQ
ncbi:MAG: phenylalanine--tRNA ligase subunit alpha [Chlorobiota bacterium]